MDAAMLAGTVSTVLFAAANLPMVVKAIRSGDLRSYSASALILGNVGNLVHTIYVVSLPFGPIWVLHGFYLATMAIMLALYAVSMRTQRIEQGTQRVGQRTRRVEHLTPPGPPSPPGDGRAAVPFRHGGHDRRARAGSGGLSVR